MIDMHDPDTLTEAADVEHHAADDPTLSREAHATVLLACLRLRAGTYRERDAIRTWEKFYDRAVASLLRERDVRRTTGRGSHGPAFRRALAERRAIREYDQITAGVYVDPRSRGDLEPQAVLERSVTHLVRVIEGRPPAAGEAISILPPPRG